MWIPCFFTFSCIFSYLLGLVLTQSQCTNDLTDSKCADILRVTDYCTLNNSIHCSCAKACKAAPACSDPGDIDTSCDCPFFAPRCVNKDVDMNANCNSTCQLRNSVKCPQPTGVPNAFVLYNAKIPTEIPRYMDKATFECNRGYRKREGSSQPLLRVCAKTGEWVLHPDHQQLVCEPKSCGAPPKLPSTIPSLTNGSFGDNVTYICDHAHFQLGGGSGRKECGENGTWEDGVDLEPVCVGLANRFVSSKKEAQPAPSESMMSLSARSNLHCASQCSSQQHCFGYTFHARSGECHMNVAAPIPVITTMKKVFV